MILKSSLRFSIVSMMKYISHIFEFSLFTAFDFINNSNKKSYLLYVTTTFRFLRLFARYQMSSSQLVRRIIKTAAAGPTSGPYR